MAVVLEPAAYQEWFDQFLPPIPSREFLPLTRPIDPERTSSSRSTTIRSRGARRGQRTEPTWVRLRPKRIDAQPTSYAHWRRRGT